MISRLLGYILLCGAVVLAASVFYRNSDKSDVPLIFSPVQFLNATWLTYKQAYVEQGSFRTIDTSRGGITTSEGQSYTMLRAVFMGDKTTFDGAWKWTQGNIFHTNDHLFAWLWGKKPNGTYGVLTAQNGETSASDADTDIALSLVFAYARWQDPTYLASARATIGDIWDKEVIQINGMPYLTADNIEKSSTNAYAAVNPSYLNPAAYRVFALIDKSHPWGALADSSYVLLQNSMRANLDKKQSAGLAPDWIDINKTTGAVQAIPGAINTTNFGFDAMRVPFRLALDWEWFKDSRDMATLKQLSFLGTAWDTNHALAATYSHDGAVLDAGETPAMYGATLGYFMLEASSTAQVVYDQKLTFLYAPGANTWKEPLSYYDDNWAWFGIALYNHLLPNLAATIPPSALMSTS